MNRAVRTAGGRRMSSAGPSLISRVGLRRRGAWKGWCCTLAILPFLAALHAVRGNDAVPQATDFEVVGHVNRDQRIKLHASLPLPDGGELGLPIMASENTIALNGTAPPRLRSISTNISDDVFSIGQEIPISVTFTSPVVVKGLPGLTMNTGCHDDACTTAEVQSFICRADEGSFAIQLPLPPGSSRLIPTTTSSSSHVLVNVPADANQDQLKYALESLRYIDEVTVSFGDSDDRQYSHGPRACTSVGNNITITFHRTSYPAVDGDLPMLELDWLNAPLDPRTHRSLGDGSFLSARFPGARVGTMGPVELVKGKKTDDSMAVYTGGNGTETLHFLYTVRAGDVTDLLDVKAFDLSGGARILSNATLEPADLSWLPGALENVSVTYPSATSLSFASTLGVNTDPARVVDVVTTNADGVYTSGDVIMVKVTFNLAVVVIPGNHNTKNGVPYIYLNSGGVGGRAFAHHAEGRAVYFKYTIKEGDYAKDLDYFDTASLVLGNGSILSLSTHPTTSILTTLPPPGMPGSISYQRDIMVDTTQPYIRNVTSTLPSGEYGAGHDIPIVITFSTAVAVGGRPFLLVDTGPPSRFFRGIISVPTGAGVRYTGLPQAGQACNVQLTFRTNVALSPGDVLAFKLPGFVGDNSTSVDLAGADGASFRANWSAIHQTAWLTPVVDLAAGERSITISASNSISVPEGGVKEDPPQPFYLSLQGRNGLASDKLVSVEEGIGVVRSYLRFLNTPTPAGPAHLHLTFTINQQLEVNDTVIITLGGGFAGPTTNETTLLSIYPATDFAAYWTSYTNVITLVHNGTAATTALPITYTLGINTSEGITYPPSGLVPSSPDITIAISSGSSKTGGDCSPTPLSSTPAIGYLSSLSIDFDNPIAGQPTGITLAFSLGPGDLEAGDVITISLPSGFVGSKNLGSLALSSTDGTNGTLFTGIYLAATRQVKLTALTTITYQRDAITTVHISASNNIALPATGVVRGNSIITIHVASTSVPLPTTAIDQVTHVTAFRSLSLSYFPALLVKQPVTIAFTFSLLSSLQVDDAVLLNLPGFSSGPNPFHRIEVLQNSTYNSTLQSGSSSHNFTGLVKDTFNSTSDAGGLAITLFAESYVPAGTQVSLLLWSSLGLYLPVTGVLDNDATLTASLTSHAGSITQPVTIATSPCVGFCSSSLAYNTTSAGSQASLDLTFTLSSALIYGDSIRVHLPGFYGPTTTSLRFTGGRVAWVFSGSWSPVKEVLTLSVTNGTGVAARTSVALHILGTNGLRLPSKGLPRNHESLQIATNAYNLTCGSTAACTRTFTNYSAIISSPAIMKRATVKYSSLDYTSNEAGATVGINISLAMDAVLSAGDRIIVTLPGFTTTPSESRANLSVINSGDLFWGSWDNDAHNLTLTARGSSSSTTLFAAGAQINVSIPISVGMQLPARGLSANDTSLILWGKLANGYIPRQAIKYSPLVPGILWSRISYGGDKQQVHRIVQIQLSMHLTASLSSSAAVRLHLPTFTGPASIASLKLWGNGTAANAGVTGSWSQSSHLITLRASHGISAGTFTVTILASNALYPPSTGHPPNWPSLRLSVVDAPRSIALNSTVTTSPCLGFCSTRLYLGLRKKGYSSPMYLRMQTGFNLTAGDRIFLHLGDFTAPSLTGDRNVLLLGGNHSDVFTASWSTSRSTITFTYSPQRNTTVLPALTPIWLHIKRRNLILLPTTPLEWQDDRLGINASAALLGNSSRTLLTWSNPVGVMYASTITYTNNVAGAATGLKVEFLASSAIMEGEQIQVDLPGFGSPVSLSQLSGVTYYWGGVGPTYPTVTWNRDVQYLTITAATNMTAASLSSSSASQVCTIYIPQSNGLRLPTHGLVANDTRLKLSVSAAAGPIVAVSIAKSPAIGALMQGSLSFTPPSPGEVARVSLLVELGGPLARGDKVILYLPGGFNKTDGFSSVRVYTNGSLGTYFNATWSLGTSTIVFTALKLVAAAPHMLIIPINQNFILPSAGLYRDDPRVKIAVNGTNAPIWPPVTLPRTDAIGALLSSSLRFASPAVAGEDTTLRLDLHFDAPFGSSSPPSPPLVLRLPSFTGSSRAFLGQVLLASSSSSSSSSSAAASTTTTTRLGAFNGTWNNNTHTVNMTLAFTVPRGRLVSLIIPRAVGIALPATGLSSSPLPAITLAVNASNSSTALLLPVKTVQPVGAVLTSLLRFSPAIAGNVSTLHFNFTLSAALQPSENLTLLLPGFTTSLLPSATTTSSPTVPLTLTTTPANCLSAVVTAAVTTTTTTTTTRGLRITFTAQEVVNSAVAVVINATNMIRLPVDGIGASTSTSLYPHMAVNASKGPIVSQVIKDTQSVGLITSASVSFSSTDMDSFEWAGGDRTLLRFPPSFAIRSDAVGEQFLIGDQVMTVTSVHGSNVTMREAYRGTEIEAGQPSVWVSSPGYRPAYYRSGNGTTSLTFVYRVRPSDNTSLLDSYNGTVYYADRGDWVRRLSIAPATLIDPQLPMPRTRGSLSYNKEIVIDTHRPKVLWVTSTKINGTYAVGDRIDIKVVFDKAVSVKASPISAKMVLPLLRMGVSTSTGAPRYATYADGNGTRSLTFVYAVKDGDISRTNGTGTSPHVPDRLDYFDNGHDPSPIRTIYSGYRNYIRRTSTRPTTDADLTLSLPGRLGSLSWQNILLVNASAPRVVRVWTNASVEDGGSTPIKTAAADGQGVVTLGAGADVFIFITFSATIDVETSMGQPYLLMRTGAADAQSPARFVALNNDTVMVFKYVVEEGDAGGALDYVCQCQDFTQTTYISLNGSVISNASIVLPTPGSPGSLSGGGGGGVKVVVDTARPRVINVTSLTPAGVYGPGEVIDLNITFTAPVAVYGGPRLALTTGDTACHAYYWSGNGSSVLKFRYVVEEGHGSSVLDYRWVDALELNGGSIKRFSAMPTTAVNLTLPEPGHWGSLGFNNHIVVDTARPYIQAIGAAPSPSSPVGGGASWNPSIQTLDLFCAAGNATVPRFRLRYGEALTTCLSCKNISATMIEQALYELGGSTMVASVHEAMNIKGEARFYVDLSTTMSGEAGSFLPIRIVSCVSGEDLVGTTTTPVATLHKPNRDFSTRFQSGVVDVLANFSSPVTVDETSHPYIDVTVGGYKRRAHYAAGRVTQVIDVGVDASSPVQQGEFLLSYEGAVTDCIGWNVSTALQSNALRNRLLEVPALAALGLRNVSGERAGNGYRFVVTFKSQDPQALQVVPWSSSSSGCQPFIPADAKAIIPPSPTAAFRYHVREGSVLTLTVRENVTVGEGGAISFLLEPDERVTWPFLGAPRGVEDIRVGVMSPLTPIATTVLPIDPMPAFLSSSLSFTAHQAGNTTGLLIGLQLNANLTVGDALNVTLPGFGGPGIRSTLRLNGSHAAYFKAAWLPEPHVVSLVVLEPVLAYQVMEVMVLRANMLSLPSHGIFRNDPGIQLSLSSPTTGHVSYHVFKYVEPVGVATAALSYGNRVADEVTDITLQLELSDDMEEGDEVHLRLSGFKAPRHTDRSLTLIDLQVWGVPAWQYNTLGFNVTPLHTTGSLADSFVADWYSHNETVKLVATKRVPATAGNLTILASNHISLPTLGLAPNDDGIKVSLVSSRMGDVNATVVPVSDAVGYFATRLLDVQPLIPGAVVTVNVSFALNADMSALEAVRVVLPGFYGCSNRSLAMGGVHASMFQGYWLDEEETWLLVARERIRNGSTMHVSLLPSNYLHYADDGLVDLPTIGTNATKGPVIASPMNVTRLGHFLHSEVVYSDHSTDPNITLSLRFRFNGIILPGNSFVLSFRGLRGNVSTAGNATALYLTGMHASAFKGIVSQDGSGASIVFNLWSLQSFDRGPLINITLACTTGLRLPFTGMQEGDGRVTLWSNSTFAPMPYPEVVAISPPVGLYYTSLRFERPQAGEVSAMNLSFSPSGRLHRGDRIRLTIPGFNASEAAASALPITFKPKGPAGAFFAAVWDAPSEQLSLKVVVDEVPPQRQDLLLPSSLGLMVPTNGTILGSTIFTLQADTLTMGRLRDVPLTYVQPVGAMRSVSLRFSPPVPGKVVEIRLSVWFTMGLHPYERVIVALPGITAGADIAGVVVDAASASLFRADWVEATQSLVFTCKADVPSQNLTITIAVGNGLRLGPAGFGLGHNFTIAAEAREGPMLATLITDFPPLGLALRSALTFKPGYTSTPIKVLDRLWIFLSVQFNFDLRPYDVIDLHVPGLIGRAGDHNLTLNGTKADRFWARWYGGNHTIRFKSRGYLPSSSSYLLSIGPENQFRLPQKGLETNDGTATISSNATEGQLSNIPVKEVQAVGVASSSLRVSPEVAGMVSSLALSFELTEDLVASDQVFLQLPVGFRGHNVSTLALTGPSASLFMGSYVNTSRMVNLTTRASNIRASTKVSLTIASSNGLRSPPRGLPSSSAINLLVDGSNLALNKTHLLKRAITDFNSFGALSPSSLHFSPSVAGEASSLLINFTTSCALAAQDAIVLHLTEFEHQRADLPLVLRGAYSKRFRATFDHCSGLLTFLATTAVPSGTITLTVTCNDTSSAIILPRHGLLANDRRLSIHSNASGCPVLPGPINTTQAVPAVVHSSLTYTPMHLQQPTSITLTFNITAELDVHDNVTLHLPGFTGTASSNLVLNGSVADNFRGYWKPSTSTVVLGVRRPVAPYTNVSLVVVADNGIYLPPAGLRVNDSRLTISFMASGLRAINATVQKSPGVGVLASYLAFDGNVQAGKVVSLRLGLTLSFPVATTSNLTITIALPGFHGPTRSNLYLRGGRAASEFVSPFSGRWDNATHTLSFNGSDSALPAGEPLVVVVDRRNGMRLPSTGISASDKGDMVLSATSDSFGTTGWVAIGEVPSVGAILDAKLSFARREAGAATTLTVNLTLSGNLTSGDQVVLGFGRMYRDWFQPVSLRGSATRGTDDDFDAEWSPGDFGTLLVAEDANAVHVEGGRGIRRAATVPTLEADLSLLPKGSGGSSNSNGGVFIDGRAAPAVVEIFSTQNGAPATYYAGDIVDINVRFTDAVVAIGEPSLMLNTDHRRRAATYQSGNGSHTLVFSYHIIEGDATSDLSCYDSRSLSVAGGAIVLASPDGGGATAGLVPANLSLPIRCNRLARRMGLPKPLRIDGLTKATVTNVSTDKADGTYGAGEIVDITVTFSQPLLVTGTPIVQLNTGANTTAAFTRGGKRQVFDIGVTGGWGALNSAFLVSYQGVQSDCVSWNATYNISASLHGRLTSLSSIQAAGLSSLTVTHSAQGLGFRVWVLFGTGFPEPIGLETAFCGGNPEEVGAAPSDLLTFRYIVAPGDSANPLEFTDRHSLLLPPNAAMALATVRPSRNVDLTLPRPGMSGSLSNTSTIVIDASAPYVVTVTTALRTGTYGMGISMPFFLTFSAPVNVTGTPRLVLNANPVQRYAWYASGSGTSTLTFIYKVQFSDMALALDYKDRHALELPTAASTIRRTSQRPITDAILLLPPVNTSGISSQANITVNYTAAARVLEVKCPLPDGTYSVGHLIPIHVQFSLPVTIEKGKNVSLLLDTGNTLYNLTSQHGYNASWATYQNGSGSDTLTFLYTVRLGDNTTRLNYLGTQALQLATNATMTDAFGNPANLRLYPGAADARALNYSSSIRLSSQRPRAVYVTTNMPNGTYGIGEDMYFEVLFSAPVSVFGKPRLQLQTLYLRADAQAVYVNGSGTDRLTFMYTTVEKDWPHGLPASSSPLVDYDGVGALASLMTEGSNASILAYSTHPTLPAILWLPRQDQSFLARGHTIRVDPSPPRALHAFFVKDNGTYGVGEEVPIRVIFSSPVTVTGTPTMLLRTGPDHASCRYVPYISGNETTKLTFLYTVEAGDNCTSLDYVDTRVKPYDIKVRASFALVVADTRLSARQLPPLSNANDLSVRRTSTHPTTIADLSLPIPGAPGSLSYAHRLSIDTRQPTVLSVTTSVPDGTYGVGFVIDIYVMWSAPVIAYGSPFILMDVATPPREAPLLAGNGTANLTFRYTVQGGDHTSLLDYKGTDALRLHSDLSWVTDGSPRSTIYRLSTLPTTLANLTLPQPGRPRTVVSPKSLTGNRHRIRIDTAGLFVVSVDAGVPDGRYGVGEQIPISLTFTEPVTVQKGHPVMLMDVDVGYKALYVSGSGSRVLHFVYTVRRGDNTPRLGYRGQLACYVGGTNLTGAAQSKAAVVALPLPGTIGSLDHDRAITIDTSTCFITNVTAAGGGAGGGATYGVGDIIPILVAFSDPVVVVGGSPQLLLRVSGDAHGFARVPCAMDGKDANALTCNYTVADGHITDHLEYYDEKALVVTGSVMLRASTIPYLRVDLRLPCPDGPRSIRGTSGAIRIVSDPPVVVNVTAVTREGTYEVGDAIRIRVRFSWPVRVVGGTPLLLLNSGPHAQATYIGGSGSHTLEFLHVVGEGEATAALDYRDTASLVLEDGLSISRVSASEQQMAVVTLPPKGQVGSLARSARLIINSDVPRVRAIFTNLRNGTYGPGTHVPLYVWFTGNVTVLQGRWPTLAMGSSKRPPNTNNASVATTPHRITALYTGAYDATTLLFALEMEEGVIMGSVVVAGAYALSCPAGVRTCITTPPPRGEEVDLALLSPNLLYMDPDDRYDGYNGTSASIRPSVASPLVSGVRIVTPFDPAYGFAPGDVIVFAANFTSPIVPPRIANASDSEVPSLLLNVARNGSSGTVRAYYNHTVGWTLFFTYHVMVGDCVEAIDYYNTTAILGHVYRKRYGNKSSLAVVTLAPPGRKGSVSFSQKAFISCEKPKVTGLFPLNRGGLYVAGEPIYIVVRFTLPVTVTSGYPTLALQTTSEHTSVATYYPYWPISDSLNFDLLPTDLLFLYVVEPTALTPKLMHASASALSLNGGSIKWVSTTGTPLQTVDRTLAPPALTDDTLGSIQGRWLGDYAKRIEVSFRGLWHEDVGDLRFLLVHGNSTVALIDRDLEGYCFGETLPRHFQPRPKAAWSVGKLRRAADGGGGAALNMTEQEMIEIFQLEDGQPLPQGASLADDEEDGFTNDEGPGVDSESIADGIGRDYFFGDFTSPNMALRAVATQSSTMFGADASRAIDGNTDGRWSYKSVSHTGLVGSGEAQPWWQLHFPNDTQPIETVRIWDRVKEQSPHQVQVVVVCGPVQPKGTFRLSFTFPGDRIFTTEPISTKAVATVREEMAGSTLPGQGAGESMQAKLSNLGALGQVLVTRSRSQLLAGYAWALTFATFQGPAPLAAVANTSITTAGPQLFTYVSRPGSSRDFYDSKLNYSTTLFPCYLMVFNSSVDPDDLPSLDAGLQSAVYWHRLDSTARATTVRLPAGTRGKYLRLQLEGLGFLSIAEVQVFPDPMRALSDYEDGLDVHPRPLLDPLQAKDPLMDIMGLLTVQGPWSLQVVDLRKSRRSVGGAGAPVQTHGKGKISDWVLLVTDYANNVRAYRMDVSATLTALPKYGELYVERPKERVRGWSDIFFGDKDERPVPIGISFRALAPCYGVDTTGLTGVRSGVHRNCYQNYGVGWSLAPADTSAMAGWTFLDAERVVYYRPRTNYLGPDSFSYEIMVGVRSSISQGTVTTSVRNCRGSPGTEPTEPDVLCSCLANGRTPFGNLNACSLAIEATCNATTPRSLIFTSLCRSCLTPLLSSPSACRTETERAVAILFHKGMCAAAGSVERQPDCATESFSLPAREAFVLHGRRETTMSTPQEDIVPLSSANDGAGFMWTAHLGG